MRDEKTIAYFDDNVPTYGIGHLRPTARILRELAGSGSSLVDIGCGAGETLEFVMSETPVETVHGIDVSPAYLEETRKRVGCETHLGSILDTDLAEHVGVKFDFAILGFVLHHLVGATRNRSRGYARLAISNALDLLRPKGHLIVIEPAYYPTVVMDAVFYVKKLVSSITPRRVTILGEWNNLGNPVVSYFSNEELLEMVKAEGAAMLVAKEIEPHPLGRLNLLLNRTDSTFVTQRTG